ncbi:Uu.00g136570.m01.CDS01, partial [Anthostomella pinea]
MPTSYGELTISIMHPFSRGNITAASASIFDAPLIDPRYCSHAFDCDLLMRGLRWNDRLVATKAMQELQPVPHAGYGPAVDDATLRQTLYNDLRTNFHPSSTTAMLPRNHGGV